MRGQIGAFVILRRPPRHGMKERMDGVMETIHFMQNSTYEINGRVIGVLSEIFVNFAIT